MKGQMLLFIKLIYLNYLMQDNIYVAIVIPIPCSFINHHVIPLVIIY